MEITKRELLTFKERKFPEKICFKPIGIIHSPYHDLKDIPIQGKYNNGLSSDDNIMTLEKIIELTGVTIARPPWNCMDGLNSCNKIKQRMDKHV